jgi:hypothetical protein
LSEMDRSDLLEEQARLLARDVMSPRRRDEVAEATSLAIAGRRNQNLSAFSETNHLGCAVGLAALGFCPLSRSALRQRSGPVLPQKVRTKTCPLFLKRIILDAL